MRWSTAVMHINARVAIQRPMIGAGIDSLEHFESGGHHLVSFDELLNAFSISF